MPRVSAPFVVALERVCSRSEVSPTGPLHHRRHELEDALGDHLELVINAGSVSQVSEGEPVSPSERLHERDDARASVRLELMKFLSDGTETFELPFRTHAIPGFPGRELTRTLDGRI